MVLLIPGSLTILLLIAGHISRSISSPNDTYCECDTQYGDPASQCGTPPLPPILLCDNELGSAFNETVMNISEFCVSGCFDQFLQCLENSTNENCTNKTAEYPRSLCETSRGAICWVIFAEATEDMILNCSKTDPCTDAEKNGTIDYCDTECDTNLNMTSEFLGCCAQSLFTMLPFIARPSTNAEVYSTCQINLSSCSLEASPSPSPSPSPTENGVGNHSPACITVLAILTLIASYLVCN